MRDHERDRLAAAVNQLRPDWPTRSVRTLLNHASLRDRPRRDVMVALTWVASESESATPARVLEAGPWWRAAAVDTTTTPRRGHVPPDRRCSVCSHDETRCRLLAATDPDPHDFLPAAHAARRGLTADQAKTVTDELRDVVATARTANTTEEPDMTAPEPEVCEDLFGDPTPEPVTLRECGCLDGVPCRHETEEVATW